jgi:putative hemolysin
VERETPFLLHPSARTGRCEPGSAARAGGRGGAAVTGRRRALAARLAEHALGLRSLQHIYAGLPRTASPGEFADCALRALGIAVDCAPADLEHVPASGPAVVVANHPFGAPEGLALAALLARRRPDVRLFANHVLARIPELRPLLIAVDPFGGPGARERNRGPLRRALEWLHAGGLLVVFPAGEVSHLDAARRRVSDPPWSRHVAALVRRSGACAVPAFFAGRNSGLFQVAGLLHPRLRTALLPRELLRRARTRIALRIGRPLDGRRLAAIPSDADLVEHLRLRTYLLGERPDGPGFASRAAARARGHARAAPGAAAQMPVAPAEDPAALAADVAALAPERTLLTSNGLAVLAAPAAELPHVLPEIGRLRERTFRAEGEGTGRARDLDAFDAHYLHLFVWDPAARAVLGAYRLAETHATLRAHGPDGLYTASLFDVDPALHRRLGPALELGRSFVRAESQRASQALFLLWRGIGRLVVRRAEVRHVLGPLSISAAYSTLSRTLMAELLRAHAADPELRRLVASKRPFRPAALPARPIPDVEAIAAAVQDLEGGRGVPVLLREYHKLGARLLDLSVDPDFADSLDALVLVDLPRAPRRLLARYLGADAADAYVARHVAPARPLDRAG